MHGETRDICNTLVIETTSVAQEHLGG